MKKLKQTRLHVSENPKERGNCYPTVLACIMGLDSPEDCLQIQEHYDNKNWYGKLVKWLREKGWILSQIDHHLNNDEFYFVIGKSPRGNDHICIYQNGKLFHDPHPDNTGLVNESSYQILTQQMNNKTKDMETKKQHIGESKLACEFEESTKTASWIGCNLYPDGTVYTKEYTQWLEKKTTSQQQTIERLREGLTEFKKRCHHNMLTTISKADRKGWKENFEDCEQLLNTTEPIDQ